MRSVCGVYVCVCLSIGGRPGLDWADLPGLPGWTTKGIREVWRGAGEDGKV